MADPKVMSIYITFAIFINTANCGIHLPCASCLPLFGKQLPTKSEEMAPGHQPNDEDTVRNAPVIIDSWKKQKIKLGKSIGSGANGKVYKATKDKNVYAIKKILKENTNLERISNEIKLQKEMESKFIVKHYNAFQDSSAYYLQLEFVEGGELSDLMQSFDPFSENAARFYAAEILCGLEHIHNKDIVFRDLKPENILLTDKGHIKIADFGFATELSNQRKGVLCGTPPYIAPEVVQGGEYTKSVDLWSLGMIIYVMIVGYEQVEESGIQTIDSTILNNTSGISPITKNLLRKLLNHDPTQRFNISETKKHLWFTANIDWSNVKDQTDNPPFLPKTNQKFLLY